MKRTFLLGALLMALPMGSLLAQTDDEKSTYGESVMVVSEYKPSLEPSFKLNVAPQIVDTAETLKHNFSYSIVPTRLTSVFQPTRIKAAKIIGEPTSRLYNNYLRLGFGSSWGPLVDAYYNSTRSHTTSYGVRLFHESQLGSIGRRDLTNIFSNDYYGRVTEGVTGIDLFGRYILKEKIQLGADLGYENDRNLCYGFSDSILNTYYNTLHGTTAVDYRDSIDRADYRMAYNKLHANFGVRSLNTDVNQFGYEGNLGLYQLWGSYGQSESHLGLDATAHYGFPLFKNQKGIVSLQMAWQHFANSFTPDSIAPATYAAPLALNPTLAAPYFASIANDTLQPHHRNTFIAHPYVDFLFRGLSIHAGARLGLDGYSDTNTTFKFYPDVVVSKSFMKEALNISLGATGGLDANSLDAIRMVNPYVSPNPTLCATKHYDLYAHMRLDFSRKLRLKVHLDYSMLRDDLNFQKDHTFALGNMFAPVYQDLNMLQFGGDFSFLNDEMLSLEVGGNVYHYDLVRDPDLQATFPGYNDQSYLAYRPSFDAHLTANLNYKDILLVHLQGLLLSRTTGEYTFDGYHNSTALDTLPMRAGVNLEVEYIITRAVSCFARFDNILAQRYFYWCQYPSRRFTALAGITYTIPTKRR